MRIKIAVGLLMLMLGGISQANAQQKADVKEVYTASIEEVEVKLFIPRDTKVLRGVILHCTNYRLNPEDRWAEMCRALGYAHMALNLEGKSGGRSQRLPKAADGGLKLFAEQSGHKELLNVPLTAVGHSAGGMGMGLIMKHPERVLTNCVSCGWVADPAKMGDDAAIPYLCTLGAIPDAFKMLPGVESNFLPARKAGRPWGLALQWGCAHDFGNSACLFAPWIAAVDAFRLPKNWDPVAGPAKLIDMKEADGWLGDRATVEGNFATVASFADFKGDKAAASWFPSRGVAYVWRAMMSKDPPLALEARAADGSAKLGEPNPKAERGMLVNPGLDVVLGVSFAKPTAVKAVEYFDGDASLGTATAEPWELTVKSPAQGPHAVFAVWTGTDGKTGTTNPALITIRKYKVENAAKEAARPEDNKGSK